MHPKQISEITEAKIIARLLELGYSISKPFGDNQDYDLILDKDGKLEKIQCKTSRLKGNTINIPCYKCRINTKKCIVSNYIGKVDAIMSYCPDNGKIYIIREFNKRAVNLHLDIENCKVSNQYGIRNAKDFEL